MRGRDGGGEERMPLLLCCQHWIPVSVDSTSSDHLIMTWSGLKVCCLKSVLLLCASAAMAAEASKCQVARSKCAYRAGCGMALQNYMIDCAPLIVGHTTLCPPACERALIALLSTEEGEALVQCDCDTSDFCESNKQRIQVCRDQVLNATAPHSVVSCLTARAICAADMPCSTALSYYYDRCRSVFHGKPCTFTCKNSLDILNRQEKAAKLKTCFCEGGEDFACQRIKQTTEQLCSRDMENSISVMVSSSRRQSTCFLLMLLTLLVTGVWRH